MAPEVGPFQYSTKRYKILFLKVLFAGSRARRRIYTACALNPAHCALRRQPRQPPLQPPPHRILLVKQSPPAVMSWWVLWCAAAALCACALAEDKRAEMSPLPFVLGSRYGRSQPAPRLLAPRNDRFFMGSRYGKRSDSDGAGAARAGARAQLLCDYTGVAALYRCERAPPNYDTRRGSNEGEEE